MNLTAILSCHAKRGVTEAKTVILPWAFQFSPAYGEAQTLWGQESVTARPATGTFIGTVLFASSVPFLPSGHEVEFLAGLAESGDRLCDV